MKLSEHEWPEVNSAKFGDDAQACYLALFHAQRHGEVDTPLTLDMIDAWLADAVSRRDLFIARHNQETF